MAGQGRERGQEGERKMGRTRGNKIKRKCVFVCVKKDIQNLVRHRDCERFLKEHKSVVRSSLVLDMLL